MMPWFSVAPVTDESVFQTAAKVVSYTMDLKADADEVWAGLVSDRPLAWCKALNGQYTSERPFGVGTTRTIKVRGGLEARERFFIWDDAQRRHAFTFEQANLPLFSVFAEDYKVDPIEGGCRFTWTFAVSPSKFAALLFPLVWPLNKKLVLDGFIKDTVKHFGAL
ncbi:SRPBCC family protein [Pseudonocardiaceae bacterium YIM PH 21723]|nr:SRPBCC family protein [Pseudonocardiaceae bacterium YIM PH 21723]